MDAPYKIQESIHMFRLIEASNETQNLFVQVGQTSFCDLSILCEAVIYADAQDASGIPDEHYNPQAYTITRKTVTNKTTLKLRMAPCGGFAVSLRSL